MAIAQPVSVGCRVSQSFDQMMAELRAEYLTTLPERIREIEAHILAKDYPALYNDFHKLKGSGKTYGIAEISEAAEVFERIAYAKLNNHSSPLHPDQWLPKGVELLKAILQACLEKRAYDLAGHAEFQEARRLALVPQAKA
jgi:HPt (histidine-containing phosphotransfer) domain-containing protein